MPTPTRPHPFPTTPTPPPPGSAAMSSLVVMSKGTKFTQQSYKVRQFDCKLHDML